MALPKSRNSTNEAAQVPKPGAYFEIIERDHPNPMQAGAHQGAAAVCAQYVLQRTVSPAKAIPSRSRTRVAGIIDNLALGVSAWRRGSRPVFGWQRRP